MRLATVRTGSAESAALVLPGGVVPVAEVQDLEGWPQDLLLLLEGNSFHDLQRWLPYALKELRHFLLRSAPHHNGRGEEIGELEVATVLGDEVRRKNIVSNVIFSPWFLDSFHSEVMTLLPGDIICTGTPGAVEIRDGDVAECRISSFEPLSNPAARR